MEYEFLIGHRVKCTYFYRDEDAGPGDTDEYYYGYSIDVTGYVQNVFIDDDNEEKIYIIEDDDSVFWFYPFREDIEDLEIKILDEIKKYTKFTRFESMEI